jgi:hypothetical protein
VEYQVRTLIRGICRDRSSEVREYVIGMAERR